MKDIKKKYILDFFIIIIILVLFDLVFLKGRIIVMMCKSIINTICLKDASALKHLEDLILPLITIFNNPFGLGFGYNGPNVLSAFGNSNLVESSVYLLAYDFGWIGMVLYLYPYVSEILKSTGKSDFLSLSGAVCALILFTYILLPNVQNFEIIFFTYFFIGIKEVKIVDIKECNNG